MDQEPNDQQQPQLSLEAKIEALLFYKGEPEKRKNLIKMLGMSEEALQTALTKLGTQLESRGIRLMQNDQEVELRTAPQASQLIEEIRKQELSRDLGKAGAETLAIVLYNAPVARADIDYIRGVNSSFILRNLMVRGLIERVTNPNDSRSFVYKPTLELLSHLGVTDIESLPDYHVIQAELKTFADNRSSGEPGESSGGESDSGGGEQAGVETGGEPPRTGSDQHQPDTSGDPRPGTD